MRKEIVVLLIFLIATILAKIGTPFASTLMIFIALTATVFLVVQTSRTSIWKRSKFLAIFATCYKIVFYMALIFAVLNYPCAMMVVVFSYAVWITFFIVASIKSEVREANRSFLYFIFTSLIASSFLFFVS